MDRGISTRFLDCSRRQKHCAGSVGGICDLPDSILSHILSFLPTKHAVATRILSHRWKFLWTMTSNLDFRIRYDKVDQDVRFVNHVFIFHKHGYMNKLSLTWSGPGCIPYYVHTWINAAIDRNVRELVLDLQLSKLLIQVQRCMFSSQGLRSLSLKCRICISNEFVFSLPKLESLSLISTSFQSEETLPKLVGGCPVLKYLHLRIDIIKSMEYCGLDKDAGIEFRCIISSDSLSRLEVSAYDDGINPMYVRSGAPVCVVELDTPLLEYMRLDEMTSICIHQSLIFLVEAKIGLDYLQHVFETQIYFDSIAKAFRTFECVKTLTLSPEVIEVLSCATFERKTNFNNLTRLEVTRVVNWSLLRDFLMWADCLKILIINTNDESIDEVSIGSECDEVPKCLSTSLSRVSIEDYDDFKGELAMVAYILKHGRVLKLMEICLRYDEIDTKYEVVKKISNLPRKSPVCRVEFKEGWEANGCGLYSYR